MKKAGVFVCHCGHNIAATVDIPKVVKRIRKYPGVAHCEDYKYMCSEPGQSLIRKRIKEKGLDCAIVACCSPSLHEETFRRVAEAAGLNRYLLEIANIREQCSWVHTDKREATQKALTIIRTMIEKTLLDDTLDPDVIPVVPRALVIGAGIAGIQAALDIANSGYRVILVEKSPSIGGHMAQLSETFPTLDCSQCILTPKMVEVGQHPNIDLHTYSEIDQVSGSAGRFTVRIRKKPRSVDMAKCTGCGDCMEKCPSKVTSEFDCGLVERTAIYVPFPQAVPNKPVIDRENCIYFKNGKCGVCKKVCEVGAIDYDQEEEIIEEEVGAVIVATGYELYPIEKIPEYGGGRYQDVIDGLQFERLLSASGPTQGEIKRPSDGKVPKRVAFISCVGSRDPENHMPYCSKLCCMYMAKHALLYKNHVPDGEAIVFSIDVRTASKDYEEFYTRAKDEGGVIYIRSKPSRVIKKDGSLEVWAVNTLNGRHLRIDCDMVVLSMAIVPSGDALDIAGRLRIPTNAHGFFNEVHPKLRPVESLVRGFYLAGCCQAPKDIPECVAQGSAAASKVLEMFSKKEIRTEAMIAVVNEDLCVGCKTCIDACPYDAREFDEEKKKVFVREALCQGCGTCVVACPAGATQQKNLDDKQLSRMIEVIFAEQEPSGRDKS
jgi:heterodisulfide reductase subunit A